MGIPMSIIIQLAPAVILTHCVENMVSVFKGDENRKSMSWLKYNTGMAATMADNNIMTENVRKKVLSSLFTSNPPTIGTE
jgi:hypothetical protein